MKILFVCDYFPPFVKGGGEISAFWQAKKLIRKKVKVIVLAPKYKKKVIKIKKLSRLKSYWFYLPFKVSKITPLIFLNPFYVFFQLIQIIKVVKKEKINIIHCQGKYSMPAAILTKLLLKIPVILTLRDFKGVCNLGFCLWSNKKSCNLINFFKKDFLFYYQNYIKKKNIFSFLKTLVFTYGGKLNTFFLSFFMKKADKFICVSNYVANIYAKNGYDKNKMEVIYNLPPKVNLNNAKVPLKISLALKKFEYKVLYAGKLSLGKGANLLIAAALEIVKKRKDIIFIFCGKRHFPIKKPKNKQLLFLGKVKNKLLLKLMSLSDIVCLPSVWPEPLSRVVLEAFSLGKPVLSSVVGGQKELVLDNKNGWLFKPTKKELIRKLDKVFKEKNKWLLLGKNGKQSLIRLKEREINKLIVLYKGLL